MKTIAIVTGASSGIGKEFFLSLKGKNPVDEIWVIARGEEKLKALQAETETPIRIFPLDLSKTEAIPVLENALKQEEILPLIFIGKTQFLKMLRLLQKITVH